jgi:hypothetical protein
MWKIVIHLNDSKNQPLKKQKLNDADKQKEKEESSSNSTESENNDNDKYQK